MINQSIVLSIILFVSLSACLIVFVRWWNKSKKIDRANCLKRIKELDIPPILQHKHAFPVQTFENIEFAVRRFDLTEDELGITLHTLLGHVLVCQTEVIKKRENHLRYLKRNMDLLSCEDRCIQSWAAAATNQLFPMIKTTFKELLDACSSYDHLTQRWDRESKLYMPSAQVLVSQ